MSTRSRCAPVMCVGKSCKRVMRGAPAPVLGGTAAGGSCDRSRAARDVLRDSLHGEILLERAKALPLPGELAFPFIGTALAIHRRGDGCGLVEERARLGGVAAIEGHVRCIPEREVKTTAAPRLPRRGEAAR